MVLLIDTSSFKNMYKKALKYEKINNFFFWNKDYLINK